MSKIVKGIGKVVGGIAKGVGKAFRGVFKAVGKFLGSDIGRIALLAAGIYFGGTALAGMGAAGAGAGAAGAGAAEASAATQFLASEAAGAGATASALPSAGATFSGGAGVDALAGAGMADTLGAGVPGFTAETMPMASGVEQLASQYAMPSIVKPGLISGLLQAMSNNPVPMMVGGSMLQSAFSPDEAELMAEQQKVKEDAYRRNAAVGGINVGRPVAQQQPVQDAHGDEFYAQGSRNTPIHEQWKHGIS